MLEFHHLYIEVQVIKVEAIFVQEDLKVEELSFVVEQLNQGGFKCCGLLLRRRDYFVLYAIEEIGCL